MALTDDDWIVLIMANMSYRFSPLEKREMEAKENMERTPRRARMVTVDGQPSKLCNFGRKSAAMRAPSRLKKEFLGTLLLRDRCSIVLCSTRKHVNQADVVA